MRFEVGYEGEFIGVYEGSTEAEAIAACRADMTDCTRPHKFTPSTPVMDRLKGGLIAVPITY